MCEHPLYIQIALIIKDVFWHIIIYISYINEIRKLRSRTKQYIINLTEKWTFNITSIIITIIYNFEPWKMTVIIIETGGK